ncbi:MAG TPA: metal-dependent hydrolase [Xanthomonadales bacterium]|nr:metal-dependent hydrolase [Xanthomonadales bacterium]
MDNLTHALMGGLLVAACAPAARRRAALVAGAVVATLPDLDVFWPWADPVAAFTMHRSATHSLFVLPVAGLLLWLALRAWRPVRESPWRWLLGIELAVVTHALIDACTVYGTQLLWPLERPPAMWANLFIIDPLVTLPLLVGAVLAWRGRESRRAGFWTFAGLVLCGFYVAWSGAAKWLLERTVHAELARKGYTAALVLTEPTPFNTVAWRVVVMRMDGRQYFEGFFSYYTGRITPLQPMMSQPELLDGAPSPALRRLQWFTQGFYSVQLVGRDVVLSDLRMGVEPKYTFRFVLAEKQDAGVVAVEPPRQVPWPDYSRADFARLWRLITKTDEGQGFATEH